MGGTKPPKAAFSRLSRQPLRPTVQAMPKPLPPLLSLLSARLLVVVALVLCSAQARANDTTVLEKMAHDFLTPALAEALPKDGASPLRNFFAITLPNLYPVLLIAIMLRFMDNFRFIDAALVLTGGGPADSTKILPIYLFEVAFKFFKLGRGAAIALTLLVVTIILGKILVRIFEKPKSERV